MNDLVSRSEYEKKIGAVIFILTMMAVSLYGGFVSYWWLVDGIKPSGWQYVALVCFLHSLIKGAQK